MQRKILGLLIIMMGIVFVGCTNPAAGPTAVAFSGLTANGTSGSVTTTELTLTFDVDPSSLSVGDITVTAATKGALTGTGTTRTLAISAITVINGANVAVAIANPSGFTITPASRTVAVNVAPSTDDYTSATIGTLKYVPAGSFQRDSTATNTSAVSAFRMSKYEITRAQFTAMLVTDPSNATYSSGTSDPVQMTNWYHAIAFCNKLSIAEGFTPVYSVAGVDFTTLPYAAIPTTSNAIWDAATANWSANGYRLPTEMEWMWAAMGATAETTGYSKAFTGSTGSNAIGDYAVYDYYGIGAGRTTTERPNPVGSKLPNELGLYDMSGNVWEWNWDWNGTYPTGEVTDYRGAASGADRVLHGGCWGGDASGCAVADRGGGSPTLQNVFFGFRVVRP